VISSKTRLSGRKKARLLKVGKKLQRDKTLQGLREKGEIRNRTVVLRNAGIKVRFLESGENNSPLLGRRKKTFRERPLEQV